MIAMGAALKDASEGTLLDFLSKHPKTQVVRPDIVFGEKHALHCVAQVLKAFAQKRNVCRNEQLEFLLAATGERRIKDAIAAAKPGNDVVFVSWSEDAEKDRGDFLASFGAMEKKMAPQTGAALKAAMERSATYWLRG